MGGSGGDSWSSDRINVYFYEITTLMSETTSSIPPKGLGQIHLNDFWKSLLLAALSNILIGIYAIIQTGAFPTKADLIVMTKSTIAIIISYILKNLGTNNVGQILKPDQPTVRVSSEKLEDLENKN